MECAEVVVSGHAVQRMFARALAQSDVLQVIRSGAVIAEYPDDTPYPSVLLLGFAGTTPLHVVVARNDATGRCIVVTAYIPDPARWSADFKMRRQQP